MEYGGVIAVVMALAVALSFFLSGMEAGVFALNRLRIRQLMRAGKPRARVLHSYLEKPEDFLWTILVGNTLANFVAVSLAVIALHQRFGSRPAVFWAVFLIGCFFFYAIAELLPKMLFRVFPNRLCLALVGPFFHQVRRGHELSRLQLVTQHAAVKALRRSPAQGGEVAE